MKTTNIFRISIFLLFTVSFFACQKTELIPSVVSYAKAAKPAASGGPEANWSVQIATDKNMCDEQQFTLTGFNQNNNAITAGDGVITLTISNENGAVASYTGGSGMSVTTHLAAGTYTLTGTVYTGGNLRGEAAPQNITVDACGGCTYKQLEDLTCEDLPMSMNIGAVTYTHQQLCSLLSYNRGNSGYGALVRLAQAIMVAKVNGFTSANSALAAAEALVGNLNALDTDDQASVVDNYGASEKGHVQDLVKCPE